MIDKNFLKEELEYHRHFYKKQNYRLGGLPFSLPFCIELFGMHESEFDGIVFPCTIFGKQLVLKIIDELLD